MTTIHHHDLATGPPPPLRGPGVLVVWWRDLPLGEVPLEEDLPTPARRRWLLAKAIAPTVLERLHPGAFGNWLPGVRGTPSGTPASELVADGNPLEALDELGIATVEGVDASDVSVVICTRDRPDSLARALRALTTQCAPPGEIVVVDNAPSDDATRLVVESVPGVRYVLERRPGLSVARNTGIRASHGGIIAFTDDDAEPHRSWTGQVARTMARPETPLAMTGLALPASLDSEAARWFEGVGSFGQGYVPRLYGPAWFASQRRRATPVWKVGAGVDMAFRREVFGLVGGFDERLGAGATGCSEDSEVWYRLLLRGHSVLYEPAAVVLHHHRDDMAGVRAQLASYAEGHVAALFVQYSRSRNLGELRRALVRLPVFYGQRLARDRTDPSVRAEVKGYLKGLRHWEMAVTPVAPPAVGVEPVPPAPLSAFLRTNPYPRPLTEGLFYREKMKAIHRVAPHHSVTRVLEIGGGRSGLAGRLFPGALVTNLDLDPAYGADRVDGAPFVAADATRLPFPTGTFDVVTLFDVLEHIEADRAAAQEALRVLTPGGWVMVSSPNEQWRFPYHRAFRRICPTDREVMDEWGHVRRGYQLPELDDLFGRTHVARATFINPVTVVHHDLAFSNLPTGVKRAALCATAPVAWIAAWQHRPEATGTETAAAWRAGSTAT